MSATTGVTSAREAGGMFTASVMAGVAGVAMAIDCSGGVEMVERLLAPYR